MPTLEALRRQVDAVEKLESIVRTMKTLASVSIRQYEQAVASLADYARTVERGLELPPPEERSQGSSHGVLDDLQPRSRRASR